MARIDKGWYAVALLTLVAVVRIAMGQKPVWTIILLIAFFGGAVWRTAIRRGL